MRYKYITATGEDAFVSTFDEAGWFDVYGYAGVRDGKRSFYINAQGAKTLETKDNLTMFDKDGLGLAHVNNGGKFTYGMLTAGGEWFIPLEYDGLGYRSCGLFCATLRKQDICLDSFGRRLFKLGEYTLLDDNEFRDDRLLVGHRGKSFFMNTKGDIVHGPYWSAQMYCDGLAYVKATEKANPMFVDVNGKIKMTIEWYDHVSEYWTNGVLQVRYKKKYGLINKVGEFIVDPTYDKMEPLFNNYILATNRDTRLVIDGLGVIVFKMPKDITALRYAEMNMVAYEKGYKWGYMNLKNGSIITEAIYEEAGPMRHDRAPVAFLK